MLIVDDQVLVRLSLRLFLDLQDDIVVVGEAGDGLEGVELSERLHPDVVLIDIVMPKLDGIEATRRIAGATDIRVLVLTSFADSEQRGAAAEAGASGFLQKVAAPDELLAAIRAHRRDKTGACDA